MLSANNFTLSNGKDKITGPLNRKGIADSLLLKTLAIHQRSQKAKGLKSKEYWLKSLTAIKFTNL